MAARSSALSRAVEFFRSGNLDECRVAFILVKEVMEARATKASQPGLFAPPKRTRTRKPIPQPSALGGTATAPATGKTTTAVAGSGAAMSASAGAGPSEQAQTLADA